MKIITKQNLILIISMLFTALSVSAQKKTSSDYIDATVTYSRLPLKPLDPSIKTYNSVVKVTGGDIREEPSDLAKEYLRIGGLEKTSENPDITFKVALKGYEVESKKAVEKVGLKNVSSYVMVIKSLYPMRLEVLDKSGKEIYTETISENSKSYDYELPTAHATPNAAEKEYDNSPKEYKKNAEAKITVLLFNKVKELLESNYSVTPIKKVIKIGLASGKGHDFADITKAKAKMTAAFTAYNAENFVEADKNFAEAIEIYKKAIKETNLEDDKARVGRRVAAMLHYNIAVCYTFTKDYKNADLSITQAGDIAKEIKVGIFGSDDSKSNIARFAPFIEDQRKRQEATKK